MKTNWRPVPQDDDVPPFEPDTKPARVQRRATAVQDKKVERPAPKKPNASSKQKASIPAARTSRKAPRKEEPEVVVLHESDTGKTRHVLYISEFEGRELISVRQQYIDKETGEWRFGKNGVSIPYERSVLVKLARGAKQLAEAHDDK